MAMTLFHLKDNEMKIKHKNLELVRTNPSSAKVLLSESYPGGKNMTKCWDRAISVYHKENNSLEKAIKYFQGQCLTFANNKRNRDRIENLTGKLIAYDKNYTQLKFLPEKVQGRLNMDIEYNNHLSGEIYRIDKTSDGYAITLMLRQDKIWQNELRFPLLQRFYSDKFKCPLNSIKIGVYNYEKDVHEYTTYDEPALNNAWEEMIKISKLVSAA
ncbi:MAG: hypothetical protein LLF95_08530 [Bacteroidales bacterium]|nr:hypothetical protein [Bacteroidales bacterium]